MLPEGTYTLRATSNGFEGKAVSVEVHERETRDVKVELKHIQESKSILQPEDNDWESLENDNNDIKRMSKYPFDSFFYPRKFFGQLNKQTKNLVDFDE